uniref:Uncharacterized protein n=1 Tax=Panagrolaimus sp. ES5 TaxID=591445 RepID=A0AC34GSI3_9BILA
MGYEKFLANHRKFILTYGIFTTLKLFFIFGAILYITNLAYTEFDVSRDVYWFRTVAAFIFFFLMVFAEIATVGIIWSMFKQDPIAQHVFTHKTLNNLDSTTTTTTTTTRLI